MPCIILDVPPPPPAVLPVIPEDVVAFIGRVGKGVVIAAPVMYDDDDDAASRPPPTPPWSYSSSRWWRWTLKGGGDMAWRDGMCGFGLEILV